MRHFLHNHVMKVVTLITCNTFLNLSCKAKLGFGDGLHTKLLFNRQ